MTDCRLPW